jgi:hypothetical protein
LVLPLGTGGFTANVTRADLVGMLETVPTGLIPLRAAVEESGNGVETSASQLLILKTALLERVVEFNAYVRTWFENTKWPASLPLAPGLSGDESTFTRPLDDVGAQWRTMELETGAAIVLKDAYGLSEFTAAVADLQTDYSECAEAGQKKRMAIQTRIVMRERIYAVLKKYREKLSLRYAKGGPQTLLPGTSFKVFVVLESDNEKGGEAVVVTWLE